MSQRTPSHCVARSLSVDTKAARRPGAYADHLRHVGPWRKIRIASARDHRPAGLKVAVRLPREILLRALDEPVRMLRDPWVIACDVIGHEVEDEGEASRVECGPRRGQAAVAAESLIDVIAAHAVGRRQNIGRRHIRERGSEVVPEVFIGRGNAQSLRTALPHPHEPHRVRTGGRQAIPFRGRHAAERHCRSVTRTELGQPDGGIDLVDDRMRWQRSHAASSRTPGCRSPRVPSVRGSRRT